MPQTDIKELNFLATSAPEKMVLDAERTYFDKIEKIASQIINNPQLKLILLAGPSGSGKTTTANLLADKLRSMQTEAVVISLDNFYRDQDDPNYPRLDDGQLDYECPESLNLDKMQAVFEKILSGETFVIPNYDFKQGRCTEEKVHKPISQGCVIIEGLHALNPLISNHLPSEKILKIFISVSTNIMDGDTQILSGRKIRFVRRLVRDSIYRGATAERTFDIWDEVLAAEDVYLYPYKSHADIAFDTFHTFELGAMKKYADILLTEDLAKRNEYIAVVVAALKQIKPVDEKYIPETSLIKEFVVGGVYENLY